MNNLFTRKKIIENKKLENFQFFYSKLFTEHKTTQEAKTLIALLDQLTLS